jgi:hypothetical protein
MKRGSAGGKATAIVSRKRALERYYTNPNRCKYCNEIIEVLDKYLPSYVRTKKFCNHSCAAKYNNPPKKIKHPLKRGPKKSSFYESKIASMTKGELFVKYKSWQSARSAIRKWAAIVYDRAGLPRICEECGYTKYVEICHIRSVSSFADINLISQINALDNLIPLCPNHHWEFDHNMLNI